MNNSLHYILRIIAVLAMAMVGSAVQSQILRTSYFMEGAQYRLALNPALAPDRGYVNLPVVGHANASVNSDVSGLDDVIDIIKNGGDDDYYTTQEFYDKLNDRNKVMANTGTELLAAGWWHGQGFMSFSVGVKANGYVDVPKSLFAFMRDMKGYNENDYSDYCRDLSDAEFNLEAYTEVALGYAHQINDRLRVGGRLKGLLGQGNLNLKVGRAVVQSNLTGVPSDIAWTSAGLSELVWARGTGSIDATATLQSSVEGLNYVIGDRGYIERARFEPKDMGVAGMGAAIDLGVAYRVTDDVELSAAINDLGFISWKKDYTQLAHANTEDLTFDSSHPGDPRRFSGLIGSGEAINLHLLRLVPEEGQHSRSTKLVSTMALGCQYHLMKEKLSLGLLFTDRLSHLSEGAELTFSVNAHPRSLLDFALSYSPIRCGGASLGLAMKLGPLFVGTDYMYWGSKTKCCNALVGLSIPLGKRE